MDVARGVLSVRPLLVASSRCALRVVVTEDERLRDHVGAPCDRG